MRGWSSGQAAHCWQNNKNAPAVSVGQHGPTTRPGPGSKHNRHWQLVSRARRRQSWWHHPDHLVTEHHLLIILVMVCSPLTGRSSDLRLLCLRSDIDLRPLLPLSAPARPGLRGLGPASANQRPGWGPSDQSEAGVREVSTPGGHYEAHHSGGPRNSNLLGRH